MLTLQIGRNVISRSTVFACVLATVLFTCVETAVAQRVHLVTVYDSKSDICESCENDVASVTAILTEWTNKSVTSLTTDVRKSGLLQKIRSLSVGRNDVLFFYYSGHGFIDAQRQHFLSMNYTKNDADRLSRNELRQALQAKRARLTILVTDCCANFCPIGFYGAPCIAPMVPPDVMGNLRRSFSATGVVDINSSSPGEKAWGISGYGGLFDGGLFDGGLFTTQFCVALPANSDWKAVCADIHKGIEASFAEIKEEQYRLMREYSVGHLLHEKARRNLDGGLRNQISQTPWKLSLPKEMTREIGVRILQIFPATTAANLRDEQGRPAKLKPNDIIYTVNWVPIKNNQQHLPDVISKMERNGEIRLQVLDTDTGLWKHLTGNVDYGTRARFGVSLRTD